MNSIIYDTFMNYLEKEDKDQALTYILDLLTKKTITIEECYLDLITPSLQNFVCTLEDKELCVWKEHIRTSIIRTILESTYTFIIERRKQIKRIDKKVMVFCPKEEYHEIGAIIACNFFSLYGYNAVYIGANTPTNDIKNAILTVNPDYIAISVTNYYNLVETSKITSMIKERFPNTKVFVGGQAFDNQKSLEQVAYDYHLDDFKKLATIEEELL